MVGSASSKSNIYDHEFINHNCFVNTSLERIDETVEYDRCDFEAWL